MFSPLPIPYLFRGTVPRHFVLDVIYIAITLLLVLLNVEELSQEQWVSRRVRFWQGAEHGVKQLSTGHDDDARRSQRRRHCRKEALSLTQVQGPLKEVKPLRPACGVLHCLERFTVQEEFVELQVSNNGYCLAS